MIIYRKFGHSLEYGGVRFADVHCKSIVIIEKTKPGLAPPDATRNAKPRESS